VNGLFYFRRQRLEVFRPSRSVLGLMQIMWFFLPGDYCFDAAMMDTILAEEKMNVLILPGLLIVSFLILSVVYLRN
jgi:hypothetical protein